MREGHAEKTILRAREAIRVSSNRGARLTECRAVIALGHAVARSGGSEPHVHFARAHALIEETGASAYRALVSAEQRARVDS